MAMVIDLAGRNAVVIGAGKGIGRSICLELAAAGANVFAVSRTEADLISLQAEVARLGVRYAYMLADVRSPAEAAAIAQRAYQVFGAIHILVNNAGLGSQNKPALEIGEEQWDATFDINVKGAFFCAQALAPAMIAQQFGRIINISSQAGVVGIRNHVAYSASKAALNQMTKVLAIEWGPLGVTTHAIAPTYILKHESQLEDELVQKRISTIPIGRYGRPDEVAALVVFLCSDRADLFNGETILIDGGYTAKGEI